MTCSVMLCKYFHNNIVFGKTILELIKEGKEYCKVNIRKLLYSYF